LTIFQNVIYWNWILIKISSRFSLGVYYEFWFWGHKCRAGFFRYFRKKKIEKKCSFFFMRKIIIFWREIFPKTKKEICAKKRPLKNGNRKTCFSIWLGTALWKIISLSLLWMKFKIKIDILIMNLWHGWIVPLSFWYAYLSTDKVDQSSDFCRLEIYLPHYV
jgi:hypothetical protein